MKKLLTLLALSSAVALPVTAQTGAVQTGPVQVGPAQTNLDPDAARLEARNARGGQLTAVSPEQALANALQRCAMLPPFYKSDCEARVKGQGEVSGSVIGGGMVKESLTTLPKADLDAALQAHQPMTLPTPSR